MLENTEHACPMKKMWAFHWTSAVFQYRTQMNTVCIIVIEKLYTKPRIKLFWKKLSTSFCSVSVDNSVNVVHNIQAQTLLEYTTDITYMVGST